jgi:hypothetical protein
MASNTAVNNPQDAVKKAGIPRVEEWKKMAADYKNSSITLGKFEVGGQPQALEQGMERMSLQQPGRVSTQNGGFVSHTNRCKTIVQFLVLTPRLAAAAATRRIPAAPWSSGTASARRQLWYKEQLPALCTSICPYTTILLCRGQVLVRH